jgi:dTDP-4-amino-4,6-dideoxygalactose transaminase
VSGEFPVAEALAREVLSIPVFPELSDEQRESVAAALAATASRLGRNIG